MDTAVALAPHIRRTVEFLSPRRVLELFACIPDDDIALLRPSPTLSPPSSSIFTHLPVLPVSVRASVPIKAALRLSLSEGAPMHMVQETWDFLQIQIVSLINGDLPGLPEAVKRKRLIRGQAQRLGANRGDSVSNDIQSKEKHSQKQCFCGALLFAHISETRHHHSTHYIQCM